MKCRMQIIALYSRMNLGWIYSISMYDFLIILHNDARNLNFSRLSSLKRYNRSLNLIKNLVLNDKIEFNAITLYMMG
jgi:hypothetical protein